MTSERYDYNTQGRLGKHMHPVSCHRNPNQRQLIPVLMVFAQTDR